MVQALDRKGIDDAAGRAGLRIERPEHHAPHARMHDGRGAHETRLECDVEHSVIQPVVAARLPGRAQRDDLRVRGRIMRGDGTVAAARHHLLAPHQHRTHGYFAALASLPRFGQGQAHEIGVGERAFHS